MPTPLIPIPSRRRAAIPVIRNGGVVAATATQIGTLAGPEIRRLVVHRTTQTPTKEEAELEIRRSLRR